MSAAASRPACPVCDLPIPPASTGEGDDAWCTGCGWQLRGPHLLGELTAEVLRDFRARLDTAQRQFDLRAAARVEAALAAAEPGIGDRLAAAVRGGAPRPGELDDARSGAAGQGGAPGTAGAGQVLMPTLTTAVAVAVSDMLPPGVPGGPCPAVVEIGADEITLTVIAHDGLGLPTPREVERWEWSRLLLGLPRDRHSRLLRLAGGIGTAAAQVDATGPGALTAGAGLVVRAALAAGATELIVASAVPETWPVPARLATALGGPGAPASSRQVAHVRAWPGETIAGVAGSAPTHHPYGLVVAEIDEATRAVRLTTQTLFPAGSAVVPGREPTADLVVRAASDSVELALVVVAVPRGTAGTPRSWRPVAIARVTPRPGLPMRVSVRLDSARTVRVTEPSGATVEGPGTLAAAWSRLLDELPATHGSRPLDLVVLVEGGGRDKDQAAARIMLASRVVELVARSHPDPSTVQVSVVGYGDHDLRSEPRQESVVRCVKGVEPSEAVADMASWQPDTVFGETLVAPLEDALHTALEIATWRPAARSVLLTIGARAPHLPRMTAATAGVLATPCPFAHDWENDMQQLVSRVTPTRVAVRGTLDDSEFANADYRRWADRVWKAFGEDGVLTPAADPRRIAELAGLFEDDQRAPGLLGSARASLTLPLRDAR